MRKTWDPTIPAVVLALAMLVGGALVSRGLGRDEWRATLDSVGGSARFEISAVYGSSRFGFATDVDTDELSGFDAAAFTRRGAPIHLTWKRDPGSFVFEGEGGPRPRGKFRFEPDAAFQARWESLGFGTPADSELLRMGARGVRLSDAEWMGELGYRALDADEMIRLADHAVTSEWVEGMQKLGYRPELSDLLRLRAHGVSVDDVRDFAELGIQGLEVEEFLRLRNHGIGPSYVSDVRSSGLPDLGVEQLTRLHSHGVPADYVKALATSGLPDLSVEAIVRLHDHAVSPELVRKLARTGQRELTVDELIRAATGM